ncbi:MAG: NTP transferase domain-containing protein [Bacteroidia bacterium]
MKTTHITGIVLAREKSSGMGTDKGLTLLNGKPMMEHILNALFPCVNDILIVANNQNYTTFGYPIYEDVIKDCGPMGGTYTGL